MGMSREQLEEFIYLLQDEDRKRLEEYAEDCERSNESRNRHVRVITALAHKAAGLDDG